MSAEVGRIVGVLQVRDEATAVVGKFQSAAQGLFGTMKELGGGIGAVGDIAQSAFSGFATGGPIGAALGAGTAIVGEFTQALKWAVGEATESEQVMKNLSIAVEKAGTSWASVEEGTNQALSALQKTTAFSDEQLAGALQRLLSLGLSYDEAMKALGSTVDFAAARHMDLEGAATIVGRALDGNSGILKRYGVDMQSAKEATAALKDSYDPLASAFQVMGDNFAEWIGSLEEGAGVTQEFVDGLNQAKDPAQYLIEQFKEGSISLDQFSSIVESTGAQFDTTKLKAAGFDETLGALNEQFGGTAQEAAQTYAGTQERLKNAMSDVGEKIGNMVLPALTAFTEGMIPVVDALGQGVDAVGAWLNEVGKMPEVQGFVSAVQGAFDGLWKGMQDFWGFLSETFGPVLQELGAAFREIFDALAPIGDAIGEVFGAITGGQGSGDWLKDFLKFVAQFIREVVVPAIKEAVPVIKGFADAFKAAADFALPIITQIKDAVVGFIEALKTTFYSFYQWLVGKSLWDDLWNGLGNIAQRAGTVIGGIVTGMFTVLSGLFKGGVDLIGTILTAGFSVAFATVQTIITGATNVLSGLIGTIQDLIRGVTRDWGDLVTKISITLGTMKAEITEFWTWTTVYWKANVNDLVAATQDGFGQIQQAVTQATQGIQAPTQTAMSTVTNAFTGAFDTISTAASGFWNWLVGGSLWPDMLEAMRKQTETGVTALATEFQKLMDQEEGLAYFAEGAQDMMSALGISITDTEGNMKSATEIARQFIEAFKQGKMTLQDLQGVFEGLGANFDAVSPKMAQLQTLATQIQQTFGSVGSQAELTGEQASQAFNQMIDSVKGLSDEVKQGMGEAFGDFVESTLPTLDQLRGWFAERLPEEIAYFASKTDMSLTQVQGSVQDAMQQVESDITSAMETVQDTTTSALDVMQTQTETSYGQIQQTVQDTMLTQVPQITMQGTTLTHQINTSFLDRLKSSWQTAQTTIQQGTSAFFDWTGMTFTEALAAIGQLWQNAWIQVESTIANIYANIQKRSTEWWSVLTSLFAQGLGVLQQSWGSTLNMMVAQTSSAFSSMQSIASSALAGIVASAQAAIAQVLAAAQQMRQQLVTGSIWPDMFNTMESITDTTMASIESTVTSGFASVVSQAVSSLAQLEALRQRAVAFMAMPQRAGANLSEAFAAVEQAAAASTKTLATAAGGGVFGGAWAPTTPLNMNPAQMADYGQKLADAIFTATIGRSPYGPGGVPMPATTQEMLKATLPISVVIDGVTVSRITEQRLITQRQLAGQYGA